jgi:hypothetical protein
LSVDAVHESETVVPVTPVRESTGALGAVVSGGTVVVTLAAVDAADECPAPSRATTVYEYAVSGESPVFVKDVPVTLPTSTPPRYTSYPVTATSSVDAVHERVVAVADVPENTRPLGFDGAASMKAWGTAVLAVLVHDAFVRVVVTAAVRVLPLVCAGRFEIVVRTQMTTDACEASEPVSVRAADPHVPVTGLTAVAQLPAGVVDQSVTAMELLRVEVALVSSVLVV